MSERWGPPTWLFFHCFAEKIKSEFYEKEYVKCFDIIKRICNILPCPTCHAHAMNYLSKVKIHRLKQKEQFKKFLFNFHNYANANTNKKHENMVILEKYKRGVFINIVKYFFQNFYSRQLLLRNFSAQMFEKKELNNIKIWLGENIHQFN